MRRLVVGATGVALAVFAVAFLLLGRDVASWVAALVSTLVGIAGLGAAIYAVVMPTPGGRSIRVARTGNAKAGAGGRAITGYIGPASGGSGGVEVTSTGDAEASSGDAVSGINLT